MKSPLISAFVPLLLAYLFVGCVEEESTCVEAEDEHCIVLDEKASESRSRRTIDYQSLIIQDRSRRGYTTAFPGADIESITLKRYPYPGDYYTHNTYYPTTVVDSNIVSWGVPNAANDPSDVLGLPYGFPDEGVVCEQTIPSDFVSLGGGWIEVSFPPQVAPRSGDYIRVFELGPVDCPYQANWTSETYEVWAVKTNGDLVFVGSGPINPDSMGMELP